MVAGRSEINACPHLGRPTFEDNLRRLNDALREGVDGQRTANLEEAKIVYIRPCISEAGRVTASTRLTLNPSLQPTIYGLFDAETMCKTLRIAQPKGDVRCSPSLGTARITDAERTLLVSKDGILNLRGATDKDEAMSMIRALSRTLWGSAVCPVCGNVGFDCASGGCSECLRSLCPLIKNGPPDMTEKRLEFTGETTVRDALERQNVTPYQGQLGESLSHLEAVTQRMAEVVQGRSLDDSFRMIDMELEGALRSAIVFIAKAPSFPDAVLGFAFTGLGLDLNRITDALEKLSVMKPASKAHEIAAEAAQLALKGYARFRSRGRTDARLVEEYLALRGTWNEAYTRTPDDRALVWALKAAENALYVCRLPDLRLPG